MYLVGHDNYPFTMTNLRHTLQFINSPHPAAGIVRMAKKEELAATHIPFEAFEINLILSVYKVKSILAQHTSKVLRHMKIGMVHGWLYQYGITRCCKAIDYKRNTRNYTRYKIEPLRLYAPVVTVLLPCHDR